MAFPSAGTLSKHLTRRMLKVYFIIYGCILLALCMLLLPALYGIASRQAKSTALQLRNTFKEMQSTSLEYLDGFARLPRMGELLLQYGRSPSEVNGTIIEQYLQTYVATYANLLMIIVDDRSGGVFRSFKYRDTEAAQVLLNDPGYLSLRGADTGTHYFGVSDDTFDSLFESNLSSIAISKNYRINSTVYTVSAYFRIDPFLASASAIGERTLSAYWVVRDNETYYATDFAAAERFLETAEPASLNVAGRFIRLDGIYYYNKIYDSECFVVGYVFWTKLLPEFLSIFLIVTVLYLLSPVLYSLLLRKTVDASLSPLKKLTDAISSYSAGELLASEIKTGDELELLSESFLEMTKKLNLQIEDIKAFERKAAITQFRLLTTQIDPHFIYNTMNIINILARKGDTKGVVEVNSNLTNILQRRLNTKISIFDTIEAELKTLRQYQVIMDYRYANDVEIRYDVEDALLPKLIPKNLLQPIVENAYFHGLSNEDGAIKGRIDVSIRTESGKIIIIVLDDGRGIQSEKLERMVRAQFQSSDPERIHIGLDNIRQRLDHIYGGNYAMDIESALGHGTTVRIAFPFAEEELD